VGAYLNVTPALVANILLAAAAWMLAARFADPIDAGTAPGGATRAGLGTKCLAFAIVASSLVVLSVEASGIAGLLNRPSAVFVTASTLAAVTLALSWVFRRRSKELGATGALPSNRAASSPQVAGPVHVMDRAASLEWRCLGVSAILLFLTWIPLALSRIALPPVAWDALTYHLAFPVTWLQRGDLATTVPASGDVSNTYYPLAGQMLLYWNLVSSGTDRWTILSQLPFLAVGGLAVAGLAVRCGARRRTAALAAIAFMATPVALRQSVEVMLDVEQAALFAMAAFFALRARDAGEGSAVLAWLATGLLAGLKYSGALLALPLLPLLTVASLRSRARWSASIAGPVAALAVGGYGYLRNAVTCGNPLMPLRIEMGSRLLLPGPIGPGTYFGAGAPRLALGEFLLSPRSILELGVMLLPSLALLAVGGLAPLRAPAITDRRLLAWIGIGAFVLSAVLLPFREHRYFLPVIAVACALAPAILNVWPLGLARIVPILLLVQAPLTLANVVKDLAILGLDAPHAFGFGAGGDYGRTRYARWFAYWSTRYEWKDRSRPLGDGREMAAAWAWLGERTRDAPVVIAYAGFNTPFPLSGYRYRNTVTFVPRNGPPDGTVYAWGKRPYFGADRVDSAAWRSNLASARASYLCVVRLEPLAGGSFPIEDAWARNAPDRFQLVWAAEFARIYAVRAP